MRRNRRGGTGGRNLYVGGGGVCVLGGKGSSLDDAVSFDIPIVGKSLRPQVDQATITGRPLVTVGVCECVCERVCV
jgi:hypothetical protein